MFISPISFSLVSNKPQKTAKYDSLPRLNDLNADTVTFTGVQKFTSKAARKARKGKRLTGQIQNPMEAAIICPITVAIAAPATPSFGIPKSPKISIGSIIILMRAPVICEIILKNVLPVD